MAIKLRSRFRGPQSALFLKAILFGGFLGLAKLGGMGIFPVVFFILAGCVLYATPFFHNTRFPFTFAVLISASIITVSLFDRPAIWGFCVLILSLLFYIFLGVKNLQFVYRKRWHYLLVIALLYLLLFLFFLSDRNQVTFFGWFLGMFVATTAMFREYFSIHKREIMPSASLRALSAGILGFCMTQLLLVISFLPFEFLNAANFTLLILFILSEMTVRHFQRYLSRQAILWYFTLFVVFSLLIFATSKWAV